MDKTEILSPVKSFWDIFQEKILNSHRFLSDKVGAFSTFSSAVFAWYYFTKCTNKFQFVRTDLEKIETKKTNSMFTFPYIIVNEELEVIPRSNSDTSKVCNEEIIKSNKKSAVMKNCSGICSDIYSDEEMENLARKYDDNYKEFWESNVLHSANEKDTRKSDTHLNDKVVPKFDEVQENVATPMQFLTDKEKGDEAENSRNSNRLDTFSNDYKWNEVSKRNAYSVTPSFASMPVLKDEDKTENKRKRFSKTKSSHKDRRRKENSDPNSKKIHSQSFTDYSFQKFIKRDVTQVVKEKLKKEKERRERIERMKKDREEMLAKIKEDRKIRAEMVRKTREQLALKEAQELERKKNQRMMKERNKKNNKEIATSQSCTFKMQSRSSSRGTFNIIRSSSPLLDSRRSKQRKRLCSPTVAQRNERVRPRSKEPKTKHNSIRKHSSQLSQKPLDLESDNVKNMFTDETLINETSKAFQKLLAAVKLYEKDLEPEEDHFYGRDLYNHCKNELGKYKALVEELQVWEHNESRRFPCKKMVKNPAEINKLEIIIHKKVNLELPT